MTGCPVCGENRAGWILMLIKPRRASLTQLNDAFRSAELANVFEKRVNLRLVEGWFPISRSAVHVPYRAAVWAIS